jgi:8-oxo-dGTP diphosphatase
MNTKNSGGEISKPQRVQGISLQVNLVIYTLREDNLVVLLRRREHPPYENLWEIPGALVHPRESLEETAYRILASVVSLEDAYAEQLFTYSDPSRDPRGRYISCAYYALIPVGGLKDADQTHRMQLAWHATEEIPPMAFDHEQILKYSLRRLRYKLEYTAVGFQLMPEEFTLTALQKAYETILGERLDKRNFRRRIHSAGVIEPTARFKTGEGRPARLYRFRPDAVAEVKARRLFP